MLVLSTKSSFSLQSIPLKTETEGAAALVVLLGAAERVVDPIPWLLEFEAAKVVVGMTVGLLVKPLD